MCAAVATILNSYSFLCFSFICLMFDSRTIQIIHWNFPTAESNETKPINSNGFVFRQFDIHASELWSKPTREFFGYLISSKFKHTQKNNLDFKKIYIIISSWKWGMKSHRKSILLICYFDFYTLWRFFVAETCTLETFFRFVHHVFQK